MVSVKKSMSAIYQADICEICKPLFQNTAIKFFNYARYYKSGTAFTFSSNVGWHEYLISDAGLLKTAENIFTSVDNGIFLWSIRSDIAVKIARNNFQIDYPIAFVKNYEKFYEIASFGAALGDDKILEFYFNNINFLEKFIFYFRDKASNLIAIADKDSNRFSIPEFPSDSVVLAGKKIMEEKTQSILLDTKINKFFFYDNNEFKYLTRREVECIVYLLRGKTAKKIGTILNISPKTVEEYIGLAKKKLNCYSRSQLFDKSFEIGLLTLVHTGL